MPGLRRAPHPDEGIDSTVLVTDTAWIQAHASFLDVSTVIYELQL